MITSIIIYSIIGLFCLIALSGIRIVRPTERAIMETLGKYSGFAKSGFNPFFIVLRQVIR